MSYRVTLSLPDVEGDNPVQAVEAFAEAARGWEQWEYSVIDEDTGLRYHVACATTWTCRAPTRAASSTQR